MFINKFYLVMYICFLFGGGVECIFVNLMLEFIKWGVKVDLVMNMVDGLYLFEVLKEVRIIDFKMKKILVGFFKLVSYLW